MILVKRRIINSWIEKKTDLVKEQKIITFVFKEYRNVIMYHYIYLKYIQMSM